MSALGTKQTWASAPHMSALGVKRTCLFAVRISAFDPKRTCRSSPLSAGHHSIQIDSLSHAFKVALTEFGETDIRAGNQVLHCPGHEALIRLGQCSDPRGDMHCNTAHIIFANFDLTSVKAGTNFDP